MRNIISLEYDHYYHIYNCGINGGNIFKETGNYSYFLQLHKKHIGPVAETFAWCLIPNHFHFLVRIKNIAATNPSRVPNPGRVNKPPHQYFSNLFNAYAQAINKRFNRHGNLFEKPFKRKLVNELRYLQQLVVYIHTNPVHHGFVDDFRNYPWSSYSVLISNKPTFIKREQVLSWFEDKDNFTLVHQHANLQSDVDFLLE